MRLAVVHLACATALIIAVGGCAQQESNRITADNPPQGVHSIFVVGHRYHTGVVVRAREIPDGAWPARSDFPDADYLELGWGEREYYPRDDPGVWRAVRALFTSSRSTINVIPINSPLTRSLRDSEIIELRVPEAGFARMVEFVRGTHELDADGGPIVISSGVHQPGRFYASPRTFHALENCNVWVARALQSAGFPVHPHVALTAGILLRQVRRLSGAAPAGN